MTNTLGEKIKYYRKHLEMSQASLCEGEKELAIKKLRRIESNDSSPTMTELAFISRRLGLAVGELIPDPERLPERYLHLKNELEKTSILDSKERMARIEQIFKEINEDFYEALSFNEKKIMDLHKGIAETHIHQRLCFDLETLKGYVEELEGRSRFDETDFLVINLYIRASYFHHFAEERRLLIVERLILQAKEALGKEGEVLIKLLIAVLGLYEFRDCYHLMEPVLEAANHLMERNHSFASKPILDMLEGKSLLFVKKERKAAERKYHNAAHLSFLLGDNFLGERILEEKERDFQRAKGG